MAKTIENPFYRPRATVIGRAAAPLRRDGPVHEQYGLKTYLLKEKPYSALLSATGRDYAEFQLLGAWGAPGRATGRSPTGFPLVN